MIKIINFFKKI